MLGEHDFRAFTPTDTHTRCSSASSRTPAGSDRGDTSSSRSPATRSSVTWCGRSSGRCSRGVRTTWSTCSRALALRGGLHGAGGRPVPRARRLRLTVQSGLEFWRSRNTRLFSAIEGDSVEQKRFEKGRRGRPRRAHSRDARGGSRVLAASRGTSGCRARARHRPCRLERSACGCTRECVRRRSDARADRRDAASSRACSKRRRRSAGSAGADRDGGERSRQRASRRGQGLVERAGPGDPEEEGTGPLSAPIANFDGICLPGGAPCAEASSCSCLPPDTNGAAGQTQFVQMVNTDFAVYSKTGQVLRSCDADQRALGCSGRRVRRAQRGRSGRRPRPVRQPLAAVAVRRLAGGGRGLRRVRRDLETSDATGAYNLYFFDWGRRRSSTIRTSASGVTATTFPRTSSRPDKRLVRSGRDRARAGQDARRSTGALRLVRRSRGEPGRRPVHRPASRRRRWLYAATRRRARVFAEVDDPSGIPPTGTDPGFDLRLWASMSTGRTRRARPSAITASRASRSRSRRSSGRSAPTVRRLPVAEGRPAGTRRARRPADVPARLPQLRRPRVARAQPHRAGGALEGIRWYEVRNPSTRRRSISRERTRPTTRRRIRCRGGWAASPWTVPATSRSASARRVRTTSRRSGTRAGSGRPARLDDAGRAGTLHGPGPADRAGGRWGDYSELSVDPTDDCTFWYTQEYLTADLVALGSWATRIGSFRFPGCK